MVNDTAIRIAVAIRMARHTTEGEHLLGHRQALQDVFALLVDSGRCRESEYAEFIETATPSRTRPA